MKIRLLLTHLLAATILNASFAADDSNDRPLEQMAPKKVSLDDRGKSIERDIRIEKVLRGAQKTLERLRLDPLASKAMALYYASMGGENPSYLPLSCLTGIVEAPMQKRKKDSGFPDMSSIVTIKKGPVTYSVRLLNRLAFFEMLRAFVQIYNEVKNTIDDELLAVHHGCRESDGDDGTNCEKWVNAIYYLYLVPNEIAKAVSESPGLERILFPFRPGSDAKPSGSDAKPSGSDAKPLVILEGLEISPLTVADILNFIENQIIAEKAKNIKGLNFPKLTKMINKMIGNTNKPYPIRIRFHDNKSDILARRVILSQLISTSLNIPEPANKAASSQQEDQGTKRKEGQGKKRTKKLKKPQLDSNLDEVAEPANKAASSQQEETSANPKAAGCIIC